MTDIAIQAKEKSKDTIVQTIVIIIVSDLVINPLFY